MTRFYAKEALQHLQQNEKGQWTCENDSLEEYVSIEVSAEVGKLLSFDQTLVHEVNATYYEGLSMTHPYWSMTHALLK